MTQKSQVDVVIVGAGQAGLGASYFLKQAGRPHVVLEKGRVGESWLSQRWDSFAVNTPNAINELPGFPYEGPEPDGFWTRDELVAYFERYVDRFDLPVSTGVTVGAVEPGDGGKGFVVRTRTDGQGERSIRSSAVVIASGGQQTPKVPPIANRLPAGVLQLHTASYRNPGALPPGAVLIVGAAQSGVQIAEDLLAAGRRVYLCTSKVGRGPRRYRGRDILEWLRDMGFLETTLAELDDPAELRSASVQISGVGRYGHTVSFQQLNREGVEILGRLVEVQDHTLLFGDNAAINVRFADQVSHNLKAGVEAYIAKSGIIAPPPEDDAADVPDPDATCASPLRQIDLREAGINTVIWATGFGGNFDWVHLPVFDDAGMPIHQRGVSPVPGLYFLGLPWLHTRKSGLICGIKDDAGYIAGEIEKWLDGVTAGAV